MANPKIRKNIPMYMGFRVFENTPSVIRCVDFFIAIVVLCFLNKSCAFPMYTKPKKAIASPAKLNGKMIKLWGDRKK
jgi:hypothetical protein